MKFLWRREEVRIPLPHDFVLKNGLVFPPNQNGHFRAFFKKNRQQNVRRRCRTVAVYRQTCLTEEDPSSFGGSGSACTVSFLFADFSFYFFYYPLPLIFCDTRTRKEEEKKVCFPLNRPPTGVVFTSVC